MILHLDAPPSCNVKIQFLQCRHREESSGQWSWLIKRQRIALQAEGMGESEQWVTSDRDCAEVMHLKDINARIQGKQDARQGTHASVRQLAEISSV